MLGARINRHEARMVAVSTAAEQSHHFFTTRGESRVLYVVRGTYDATLLARLYLVSTPVSGTCN